MKIPITIKDNQPFDAVCFGYNSCDLLCLLPRYPQADEKVGMKQMVRSGGGQAATAAATMSRLGLKTRYLGKFGDTTEGDFSRESLIEAGVDVGLCKSEPHTQNQVAVVWVDSRTGKRAISALRDPKLDVIVGDFSEDAVCSGGLLLLDGHHLPVACQMAQWAKDRGIPVLLDIERVRDRLPDLLDLCDGILCNSAFPEHYINEREPEKALRIIRERHGAPIVAMTLGAKGSLALINDQIIATPAFQVDVVDTTGAGDVWHGAFAAALAWEWEVEEVLRFAAAAAAIKCTGLGGRYGIVSRERVEAFINETPVRA